MKNTESSGRSKGFGNEETGRIQGKQHALEEVSYRGLTEKRGEKAGTHSNIMVFWEVPDWM